MKIVVVEEATTAVTTKHINAPTQWVYIKREREKETIGG
jgi:hypothetical protein